MRAGLLVKNTNRQRFVVLVIIRVKGGMGAGKKGQTHEVHTQVCPWFI